MAMSQSPGETVNDYIVPVCPKCGVQGRWRGWNEGGVKKPVYECMTPAIECSVRAFKR